MGDTREELRRELTAIDSDIASFEADLKTLKERRNKVLAQLAPPEDDLMEIVRILDKYSVAEINAALSKGMR